MPFIKFSARHPVSVLMAIVSVMILGGISLFFIHFDFMPKLGDRYLLMSAEFDGVSAAEMRKLVTVPLEDSISSLKGVKTISSVTRDGLSLVKLELHWNVSAKIAAVECRELIDQSYETLPHGCSKPAVKIYNPSKIESVGVMIIPRDGDLKFARYICDTDIKARFQRIDGVASVSVQGGEKEEVHVILDKEKTESLKLSLDNVAQVLSSVNFEYPAGKIKEGNKELLFKTRGLFNSEQEIENVPLSYGENGLIRIGDIGIVKNSVAEKKSFFLYEGKEAVSLQIFKKSDASPLVISRLAAGEIRKLESLYGNSLDFKIFSDQSVELKESLRQLAYSALLGVLITSAVLFLFLRKIKVALLAASIIPLTVLVSVLVLYIGGRSVNLLSVSGIAIGIGMVIDPAVIAIENLISKKIPVLKSEDVAEAVGEVSLSTIGSTLTTIVVFIPFFFLPGLTGKLFSDLSLTVIASIGSACLLSVSYIPAMLVLLFKGRKFYSDRSLRINIIEDEYKSILYKVFRKKWILTVVFVCSVFTAFFCIHGLKKELFPKTAGNYTVANIYFREGCSIGYIKKAAVVVSKKLAEKEFIKETFISGGIESDDFEKYSDPTAKKEMIRITCMTTNQKLAEACISDLFSSESFRLEFVETGNYLSQIINSDSNLSIIYSNELENLSYKLGLYSEFIKQSVPDSFVSEYVFEPDRTACARFGVSAVQASSAAHDALDGVYSAPLYKKSREIPILVKYEKKNCDSIDDLMNTTVFNGEVSVPLSALGNIRSVINEKVYYRYNRKDAKKVELSKNSMDLASECINPSKNEMDSIVKSTFFLLLVVLLLLYCVMGAQFESFLLPLLMFFAIPPAFSGAFLSLLIACKTININSIIALVVLFGTAVNNSILLYESLAGHKAMDEKNVIESCASKLRPIMITTVTTVLALVPFAVDFQGKNAQSSMAVAIIGGLVFSFVVVLIIIPPVMFACMRKGRK